MRGEVAVFDLGVEKAGTLCRISRPNRASPTSAVEKLAFLTQKERGFGWAKFPAHPEDAV